MKVEIIKTKAYVELLRVLYVMEDIGYITKNEVKDIIDEVDGRDIVTYTVINGDKVLTVTDEFDILITMFPSYRFVTLDGVLVNRIQELQDYAKHSNHEYDEDDSEEDLDLTLDESDFEEDEEDEKSGILLRDFLNILSDTNEEFNRLLDEFETNENPKDKDVFYNIINGKVQYGLHLPSASFFSASKKAPIFEEEEVEVNFLEHEIPDFLKKYKVKSNFKFE